MPNDVRDLPASNDGLYRFLGGSPLSVAFRLILLSILVGVVLAAIGFDPWNILHSIQTLFRRQVQHLLPRHGRPRQFPDRLRRVVAAGAEASRDCAR